MNEVGGAAEGDAAEAAEGKARSEAGADATVDGDGELVASGAAVDGAIEFAPHAQSMAAIKMAVPVGARVLPLIDPSTFGILSAAIPDDHHPALDRPLPPQDRALPDWIQRVAAAIAIALLGPVLLAIAIAVRIDSRGPVLFAAHRVGRGGAPFIAWKFRTMDLARSGVVSRISGPADPRVTRVGAVLRRVRLDELPQLWNVLLGEMRLVGPRPEDPAFINLVDPQWIAVLALRPGITGLAQLAFHDETLALDGADPEASYREIILPRKLAVDAAYARRRSVRLDIRIAAATLRLVAAGTPPEALVDDVVGRTDWRVPRRSARS